MAAQVGVVSWYRLTRPCFSSLEVPRLFRICSSGGRTTRTRGRHRHPDSKAGKLNGMRRVEERRCCDLSQSRCATWSGSVRAVFVAATT